jgi:glycosyltransferase involved in cell wall biosynthesis
VKVSVVVPVYNVEKYLPECLDSILSQSLEDIEVICVNDGSTDGSPDILKDYESRDSRVKVITQENRGLASSRNVGMDLACGEYITFIDSDDYFTENALNTLYDVSKRTDADFTIFKLLDFDDETRETSKNSYFDMPFLKKFENHTFNHDDVGERFFNISATAPGKMFKREFIDQLRFPEDILFEDTPFTLEAVFMAEKMYFLDEYMYMRRIRKDSITHSNFSRFSDCIDIFNMMADIARKYEEYDLYKEKLFTQRVSNTYSRFSQITEEYKDEFFSKAHDDFTSKREEFERSIDFDKISPRIKHIFYAGINSKDWREFEKSVESFDGKKDSTSKVSKVFKKVLRRR